MEVFLIDVLRLKNKDGQRVFEFMKQIASDQAEPASPGTQSSNVQTTKTKKTKNIDDPRDSWMVGSKCQIFSKSQQKWVQGEIVKIFNDEEGEWLRVRYGKDNIKEVQRYSEQLRPTENKKNIERETNDEDSKSNEAKWANLVCIVSTQSLFENWKTFNYSSSDDVNVGAIEQRLSTEKNGSGKFKIVRVGTFAYYKKENPKGYRIAVRCNNNSYHDAQGIVEQIKLRLDAKLEKVEKIEKFKYKHYLDKIIKEIS